MLWSKGASKRIRHKLRIELHGKQMILRKCYERYEDHGSFREWIVGMLFIQSYQTRTRAAFVRANVCRDLETKHEKCEGRGAPIERLY